MVVWISLCICVTGVVGVYKTLEEAKEGSNAHERAHAFSGHAFSDMGRVQERIIGETIDW